MQAANQCQLEARRLVRSRDRSCHAWRSHRASRYAVPPATDIALDQPSATASSAWHGQKHSWAQQACSVVLGSVIAVAPLIPAPAVAAPTPYELANSITYGVVEATQSLPACPSNVNPNCVSTGSTNETYGPAWRSDQTDPEQAARALEDAVFILFPDTARLLKRETVPGVGEYRAFGIQGMFGQDVAEFLILSEGVTNRNWEGDSEGALVTYRAVAGGVRYIWPIQQPITDFGAQRKRLEQIRQTLGWRVIGCELVECYLN